LELLHPRPCGEHFEPASGMTARFSPAGHILGAASAWLSNGSASVLFSGDLGRSADPIMCAPAAPLDADHIIVESTYGARLHPDDDAMDQLAEVISSTSRRGGIVLVPVFAVGRAQTVLHLLALLRKSGRIPDVPTYLNSPMAVTATELFLRSGGEHRLSEA